MAGFHGIATGLRPAAGKLRRSLCRAAVRARLCSWSPSTCAGASLADRWGLTGWGPAAVGTWGGCVRRAGGHGSAKAGVLTTQGSIPSVWVAVAACADEGAQRWRTLPHTRMHRLHVRWTLAAGLDAGNGLCKAVTVSGLPAATCARPTRRSAAWPQQRLSLHAYGGCAARDGPLGLTNQTN